MTEHPLVAEILEANFDTIFAEFEERTRSVGLSAYEEAVSTEQFMGEIRTVINSAVRGLRGQQAPKVTPAESDVYEQAGAVRAHGNVSGAEARAMFETLSEVALSTVVGALPARDGSGNEVAIAALAIQRSVHDAIVREIIAAQDYLLRKVHRCQAEERRRIGRELHDRLAHLIAVVCQSIELHEALGVRDSSQAEAELGLAHRTAEEALELVRRLSTELRNSEAPEGLAAAVSDLLLTHVPRNVHTELYVEGDESKLEAYVRDELFLILREAIRNAVKHSSSESIGIDLSIADDRVKATVSDHGIGFDTRKCRTAGEGLGCMEERAQLLRGSFKVASAPNEGTRVEVAIPLLNECHR